MNRIMIVLCFIILSVSTAFAFQTETNTVTVNSTSLGVEPTISVLIMWMKDSSGTVLDGIPDNDNYMSLEPFGSVGAVNTDPQTAPNADGHDITGTISQDIDFNLSDTGLTVGGGTNFRFNSNGGKSTIEQMFSQTVNENIQLTVDNTDDAEGVTFDSCDSALCVEHNAMNLPYKIDIDQALEEGIPVYSSSYVEEGHGHMEHDE